MTDSFPGPEFDFLTPALERLAQPCSLQEFSEWYAQWLAGVLPPVPGGADAGEARRLGLIMARMIWQRTPDPAAGWRLRSLPQPSRNDPCPCGSGRKYKQCCQLLQDSAPELELDPVGLGGLLAALGPASLRELPSLRAMPPLMLAAAADAWRERHGAAGVVDLLEPLFLAPRGLDARHGAALDELMDAMLEQRLDVRREQLARTVVAHASDRRLRCAAHYRLASILSDRGQVDLAWTEFRAAQREEADAPELLHLELVLLLAQGRLAEAKTRTPLLAARARKLGYPDLAQALVEMEQAGPQALHHGFGAADEEEQAWSELLRFPLAHLQADVFVRLHDIVEEAGPEGGELAIVPKKQVRRRLAAWTRRFGTTAPALTSLDAESGALLDEPQEALAWLQERPELCAAVPVLDDLVLAARAMRQESAAPAVRKAAAELAYAAAGVVVEACARWPQARLSWLVMDNRPVLRIVTQAIALALFDQERERAEGWMRWMLARNPTDNHGWREVLRVQLLRKGDARGALEVLETYPDDAPPSGHDRALALFMLDRRAEAEQALRAAHAEYPAFVQALLPPALDRPAGRDDGYVTVGGPAQAWYWRSEVREAWQSCGALEWLRGLALPAGKAARKRKPAAAAARKPKRPAPVAKVVRSTPATDPIPVLRDHFGQRLPWALGWLASAAWSPELVMPTLWLGALLEGGPGLQDHRGLDALLAAVMEQYNAFNTQVLAGEPGSAAPMPDAAIAGDDDAGWIAFTAGFVQFAETHARGAWRVAGLTLDARKGAFAPLYQLAAQAPPQPQGWTPGDQHGRALLTLADNTVPGRELLERALAPLWRAALAAR